MDYLSEFEGKRVLITGASAKGIGRGAAAAFLRHGAIVAINGRSNKSVSEALRDLNAGEGAIAVVGDVASVDECEKIVSKAIDEMGGLDVLVNSAGTYFQASILDTDEAIWDSTIDTNVKGSFYCSRAAIPALKETKGSIVNIASQAGLEGYSGVTAYCASKGAVINMTRAMAIELAPDIRVNCVCPGAIDTDMAKKAYTTSEETAEVELQSVGESYPMKKIGSVEEVASAILYLASSDSGFTTGIALPVDGGATAGG